LAPTRSGSVVNGAGSAAISWGTGDSITLDGYKASKLSAADFSFGPSAPLAAFAAVGGEMHFSHTDVWLFSRGGDRAKRVGNCPSKAEY
jgi:hypothetical protein